MMIGTVQRHPPAAPLLELRKEGGGSVLHGRIAHGRVADRLQRVVRPSTPIRAQHRVLLPLRPLR